MIDKQNKNEEGGFSIKKKTHQEHKFLQQQIPTFCCKFRSDLLSLPSLLDAPCDYQYLGFLPVFVCRDNRSHK